MAIVICHDVENGLAVLVDTEALEAFPCVFGGPSAGAMAAEVITLLEGAAVDMRQATVWQAYLHVVATWEELEDAAGPATDAAESDPQPAGDETPAQEGPDMSELGPGAQDAVRAALEAEIEQARRNYPVDMTFLEPVAVLVGPNGESAEWIYAESRRAYVASDMPDGHELLDYPFITDSPDPADGDQESEPNPRSNWPTGAEECFACAGSGTEFDTTCGVCRGAGWWRIVGGPSVP